MPIINSINKTTGVVEYFDYDEMTGTAYMRFEKDVERFLAHTAEIRNTGSADANPLFKEDKEFHCYAQLDPIVMMELRQKGIDIYSRDPSMQKRMFKEIEANYPWCKVTNRKHFG